MTELQKGIKIEAEHSDVYRAMQAGSIKSPRDMYSRIAKAHLREDPHYYTKLAKVETNPQRSYAPLLYVGGAIALGYLLLRRRTMQLGFTNMTVGTKYDIEDYRKYLTEVEKLPPEEVERLVAAEQGEVTPDRVYKTSEQVVMDPTLVKGKGGVPWWVWVVGGIVAYKTLT